jgi:hypothetical protein
MTGGCLCGSTRFQAAGTPRAVHYCHCGTCRRATGGPFAVLVWWSEGAVQWTGAYPHTRRSSPIAERGFCGACGTPLFLRYDNQDRLALTIGCFDDPTPLQPTDHYGIESRIPWVECGPGLPGKETQERS